MKNKARKFQAIITSETKSQNMSYEKALDFKKAMSIGLGKGFSITIREA